MSWTTIKLYALIGTDAHISVTFKIEVVSFRNVQIAVDMGRNASEINSTNPNAYTEFNIKIVAVSSEFSTEMIYVGVSFLMFTY